MSTTLNLRRDNARRVDSDILVWCFCIFVVVGSVSASGAFEKYVIYLMPVLGLLLALLFRGELYRRASRRELVIGAAILAYGFIGGAFSNVFDFFTVKESLLIGLPYFCTAYVTQISARQLRWLGIALVIAIAVAAVTGHAHSAGTISWSKSSSYAETAYSFPLMIILLTLVMKKIDYPFQAGFGLFELISLKRSAILGSLGAVAFRILAALLSSALGKWSTVFVYFIAVLIFASLAVAGLNFPTFVLEANHYVRLYYLSPEEFMQGRFFLETYMMNYSHLHSTPVTELFGHGLGQVPEVLSRVQGRSPMEILVHNDFFKMYFEGGYVFLIGYCLMLFVAYGRNSSQLTLLVYQGVLFLTDNTLVYVFHMVPLLLCLRYLANEGTDRFEFKSATYQR